jgi:Inositol polyphosphate kinase
MFSQRENACLCCRAKEAGSWQHSHGYKISGMRVWHKDMEQVLDKAACQAESKDMPAFLTSFADDGRDWRIRAVWKPVQAAVGKILEWVRTAAPPCWHLYSASLLVVYESVAQSSGDVRVRCSLIDFSHTFFAEGRDTNFEEGLQSLWAMLETITSPYCSHNSDNVG